MYYFISYTVVYVVNTQFPSKQWSIADFAIVAKDGIFLLSIVTTPQLICDVTRTGVLALWRLIRRLFLQGQIGTTGIRGLAYT